MSKNLSVTHDPDLPPLLPIYTQVITIVIPPRRRLSTFTRRKPFKLTRHTLLTVPEDTVPQGNLVSFDDFFEQQVDYKLFKNQKKTRNVAIA